MLRDLRLSTLVLAAAALAGPTLAQQVSGAGRTSQATSSSTAVSSSNSIDSIGGLILGGLGQSGSSTVTASSSQPLSISTSIRPTTSASSRVASATVRANISDCQAAIIAWSKTSDAILAPYYTTTVNSVPRFTTTLIELGDADVVGVTSGYTHAVNFTLTEYKGYVVQVVTVSTNYNALVTPRGLQIPPKPSCTIDSASCAALYRNYSSSLGLTRSGQGIPYISPTPDNSPRCNRPGVSCTPNYSSQECTVSGRSVQVFYWPSEPTGTGKIGTGIFPNRTVVTRAPTGPRTIVTEGITMTSPSVYLSFDLLSAYEYTFVGQDCGTVLLGAQALATVGSTHTNSWLSFMPSEISTLEKIMGYGSTAATFPNAALTAMGKPNATDYQHWATEIESAVAVTASRLNFNEFTEPGPRAYYLRPFERNDTATYPTGQQPERYAKGCFAYLDPEERPLCHTIFNDLYRAQLSLPSEVRNIDPAWSTCGPRFWGVYDPPKALTAAEDAVAPDPTPITTTSATADPPTPPSGPGSPTVSATALPVSLSPQPVSLGPQPVSLEPFVSKSVIVSPSAAAPKSSTQAQAPPPAGPVSADPAGPANPGQQPGQTITFSPPVSAPGANAGSGGSPPTAVITAGSSTITATSTGGNVIIGSNTIAPGQVTVVDGATLSNAGSAVVVQPAPTATTITSIGTQPVVALPGSTGVVVGGTTLTAGQSTTISGTAVSIGSTAVVIGSSTIALPTTGSLQTITSVTVQQPSITVAGTVVTANANGQFVVNGVTITPGGPAVTLSGTTISLAPSDAFVVVNGQTMTIARPITSTVVVTVRGTAQPGASATRSGPQASYTGAGSALEVSVTAIVILAGFVACVL